MLAALAERLPRQSCCCNTTSRAAWQRPARRTRRLRALEQAVTAGWADAKHTQKDPDLESLRANRRLSGAVARRWRRNRKS